MEEYNVDAKFKALEEEVNQGIIPAFMVKERIQQDPAIPGFAREKLKQMARRRYGRAYGLDEF